MTADEFRALLAADPFEPFTVHLAGGSSCEVNRPEWASASDSGTAELRLPDGRRALVALRHVLRISYADTPFVVEGGGS